MVTHSMENILNMQYYSPVSDEPVHSPPSRKKRCLAEKQDPMSHRIIEKRRRDRMNNCLADLSRLIPAEYLKKGRGRVEKTEIIEMAIRHMKYLQGLRQDSKQPQQHTPVVSSVHHHAEDSVDSISHPSPPSSSSSSSASAAEHYRLGYQECLSETMHFLVEVEGFFARDALVVQLISHLQQHCNKILASSDRLGFPHLVDLATNNGPGCTGEGAFSHANGGIPSMCSNGTGSIGNGLDLFIGIGSSPSSANNNNSNVSNNNNNNNSSSNNLNGNSNSNNSSNGHQQHPLLQTSSSGSDRCSSSGVSSYDPSESKPCQRPFIPPPNLTSDDSNHSSHSHGSGGGFHHHHHHLDQQRPSTYKFKNSIKQRFSADQRSKSSCSPPPCQAAASQDSPACQPSQQQQQPNQQGVPIFALHDNGGFYVPLTVEASVLRPQLGCANADLGTETVLHPVTISVNFNHSTQQPQHHQAASWSHPSSPPHQVQ